MNTEQRIKLAEAMGWTYIYDAVVRKEIGPQHYMCWKDVDGNLHYPDDLPDPFTDANDDYAVLEWMRTDWANNGKRRAGWGLFKQKIVDEEWDKTWHYRVGDYARAAIDALETL